MKTTAAFFDIDGTLYREALSVELFKRLSKNNIINPAKWHNEIKPIYDKWSSREGGYDDYIEALSKVYQESIIGLNSGVLSFLAKQIIDEKGHRLFRYTKNKLLWHKKQGHKVIIISGAPYELASQLAAKLGADDCIGTKTLTDENSNYTNKTIPMWDRESKLNALQSFVKKYDIDLSQSYAYGDTNGDFTMLQLTAFPTVINPTSELIDKIKEHKDVLDKITTIIERKDVMYKINLSEVEIMY